MRIVHNIPGRLRLRLVTADDGDGLAESMQRVPGVQRCAWSARTHGLLILYQPESTTAAAIVEALRERGGFADSPADAGTDAIEPHPVASPVAVARTVAGAFGELDGRVRRATRGTMGLGTLIPMALGVWAVRELLVGRATALSWSSALWYAHGLFRDYNSPSS